MGIALCECNVYKRTLESNYHSDGQERHLASSQPILASSIGNKIILFMVKCIISLSVVINVVSLYMCNRIEVGERILNRCLILLRFICTSPI